MRILTPRGRYRKPSSDKLRRMYKQVRLPDIGVHMWSAGEGVWYYRTKSVPSWQEGGVIWGVFRTQEDAERDARRGVI